MGLLGIGVLYGFMGGTLHGIESIEGFAMGGSSVALFSRVGGGIFTKSADVGADGAAVGGRFIKLVLLRATRTHSCSHGTRSSASTAACLTARYEATGCRTASQLMAEARWVISSNHGDPLRDP